MSSMYNKHDDSVSGTTNPLDTSQQAGKLENPMPAISPHAFLHEVFEAQAARTPLAPAVCFEGQVVTYQTLNRQANQLASFLKKRGIGPDTLVGVYLHRSHRLAVVLLAILKAGGAFVPLDASYPDERLRYMIDDAQLALLITQQSLSEDAHALCSRSILTLEEWWEEILRELAENHPPLLSTKHLAYMTYTSGSTGHPKGIMISHEAAINFFSWLQEYFKLDSSDSVLQKAPLSFDASICEFFWPLFVGARLIMARPGGHKDTAYLVDLIEQQQITTILFVPSMLQLFLEEAERARCRSLKRVIAGGEVLTLTLQKSFLEWVGLGHTELYNTYGPTETVVFMTYWLCKKEAETFLRSVPLGLPIGNVHTYILDTSLQILPSGAVGELYIGGAGVARGYAARPDLTAERFLPDPYSGQPGARMYRTGDMVRSLPSGEIDYVGRFDNQVKIRGNRIELEEIEQTLLQQPMIKQAVVLVHENALNDKRLVAFVVPHSQLPHHTASSLLEKRKMLSTMELWPSIGEYTVYDELIYYGLTHDEPRNRVYKAAFEQVVKDKVVLDIGTGRDAILARLCIEAGARHVYAVEKLEASFAHAQELVQRFNLQDRITVMQGDVTQIQLPETIDVGVSEIFESIGGAEGAAVILNGVQKYLAPDATMIPARCLTNMAAVSLPDELYLHPTFTHVSSFYANKIFEEVGHQFDLRLCIKNFSTSHLISTHDIFEEVDCHGQAQTEFHHDITLTVTRRAQMHGFLLWLVLELVPGQMLDILDGKYSWFPAYFPVFDPGIEVEPGDRIEMSCIGTLSDDHIHLNYEIKGELRYGNGTSLPFSFTSYHHHAPSKPNTFYQRLFAQEKWGDWLPQSHEEQMLEDIRTVLRKQLPEYMLPSSLILIHQLPINASGKIDRQELLAHHITRQKASVALPETSTQLALADIWATLLGEGPVGLYDNFFARGGHSLLVIRLVAKIRERFHIEFPLARLFEVSDLAAQAQAIDALCQESC